MKRVATLILGGKIVLLLISLSIEEPIEVVQAYEDTRPVIEIMTDREYREYLEEQNATPIMVGVEYSKESIEQMIRDTFPEDPERAVKIAYCESNLERKAQSFHILSYGRELSFGIFQIHAPVWHEQAMALGLTDYKTGVEDNLKMARYIYDLSGWEAWSCNKML